MSRLRERTTATLLIAIFMTSIFAVAMSVSAQGTVTIIAGEKAGEYTTIQDAINAANDGDTILVGAGEWYGGIVNKPVRIIGMKGAIIVDGPAYPCLPGPPVPGPGRIGFYIRPEGKGSTLSHFTFRGGYTDETKQSWLAFAIFARIGADGVTFTHNKIINCRQCITFRDCDDWTVTYNTIKGYFKIDESEGRLRLLGIFFGTVFEGYSSTGNFIAYNEITATGALSAVGIIAGSRTDCEPEDTVLGRTGNPGPFTDNIIIFNRIRVKGDYAVAVRMDVNCFSCDGGCVTAEYAKGIIHDNVITYNNFKGCTDCYEFNPPELKEVNTFSYNRE